jgi:hypothetical protein
MRRNSTGVIPAERQRKRETRPDLCAMRSPLGARSALRLAGMTARGVAAEPAQKSEAMPSFSQSP